MKRISRDEIETQISIGLKKLGISAPAGAAEALAAHLALVAEWNRAYNLTAVRDPAEMVARHVLDSATALPFLRGKRMLDAGSGAGFPGIVLALLAPETVWVLVESNGKKARFLHHALRHLDLSERVSVVCERLERFHPAAGFDTVTARALAELATLASWAAPLLAPAGRLVAFKGRREQVDAERLALGAEWRVEITAVKVPDLAAERHIVIMERNN
ncbi:MAG: 16S rRNA (guanine(527)-N(7))-methyltransferase RsmG [Gammaproteobacteria bacterium]